MKKFILLFLCLVGIQAYSQEYGVVNISVCNLRSTANFDAEMVSQALLGTPVHVLQISTNGNPWPQVQTPDDYVGWVHYAGITRMSKEEYSAWNAAPKVIVTALNGIVYQNASEKSAVVSDIVAGDRLKYLGKKGAWLKVGFPDGRTGYICNKTAQTEEQWRKKLDQSTEAILATAQSMLGFPYIWAGMSPKGMDCSGFVRTALLKGDKSYPMQLEPAAVEKEIVDGLEKRKAILTIDWRYRILVFFWRLIPRCLWVRMKVVSSRP